jgi:hypothetical protein
MKKFLFSVLAIVAILTASCQKESVKVEFVKSRLVLLADTPLEVEMKLSKAPVAELTIPVSLSGTAVKGEEYEISSESFKFEKDALSAKVIITPINNIVSDKEIILTIGQLPQGYELGITPSAIVSVEKKEGIIYSFSVEKADLLDTYSLSLTLAGETSGANFTATADMELPFLFTEKSTAKEGTDFEIVGGNKVLTVKAGTNKANVSFKAKDVELGKELVINVAMDKEKLGGRFLEGNIPSVMITIKGVMKGSALVGTWKFKEIPELAEWKTWVSDMEDDPELMPIHNENYEISFTLEEDVLKLIPGSVKGDLSNFLREAVMTYSTPVNPAKNFVALGAYCTEELFMWTSETIQLTYFSLDKANRAFSASKEDIKPAVVAMRFNESGELELHLRDYDQPPFMFNWWGGFDTDMFGFCYVMTKIK